jgi:type III restriction enzyme
MMIAETSKKGKIALWFEELYEEISKMPMYKDLLQFPVEDLHDGYFSADKKKGKIVELLDTSGNTEKDNETYELIMRDKERLLSLDVPLRFIFSHSALKEGWDNPNVFQICNLREMGTDRERRQTIGRGLRLPVNQEGDRIFDEQINRLTVIANETFETFAKGLQTDIEEAIDPNGNFKFGRVAPIAFTVLLNAQGTEYLTQNQSEMIWKHLRQKGFIDENGEITNSYQPNQRGFTIQIPSDFDIKEEEVINRINKFVKRDLVTDARKRQKISYRKRVELNPEFRILWDKISQKTHYSLEFETQALISKAVSKIQEMEEIRPVQILITKRDLLIKEAGLESEEIRSNRIYQVTNRVPLPDILAHLQQETELTRKTLVEILKQSGKLNEFTVNPQMFMTEVAKKINRALNEMIIDGIKYEPFQNEFYEMKLFENDELEGYLNNLYEIQNMEVTNGNGTTVTKTPYDYIEYQSQVEKDIATLLDHEERVKFFCKLPTWFKVPTPLGEYIPDWAVVLEGTNKLYLVRESKSTLDHEKLRSNEAYKIKCGKAHFTALGVDFKVATNINEVLGE